MPDVQPSPELFFSTIFAPQRTAALKSGIDLGVFTLIDEGLDTADALAEKTGASLRGIRILCDNLTLIGFLAKDDGKYRLTADSAMFLSRRSPAYLGGTAEFLTTPELGRQLDRLTETIRVGSVPSQENMVSDENPIWVKFARAMVPMMMPNAHVMADALQVEAGGAMRVLDIAAGHGIFGIVIAQRNPNIRVVALDWAPVLEVAKENARAMGVDERYETKAGSAFKTDLGRDFDLVLLTNFLHHFDRDTCVGLLRRVHAALKSGGRVALLEFVPNEDRVTPPLAASFSLRMLAATPAGDAYTLAELHQMLAEAGFSAVSAHATPTPETVVIARA